MQEYMNLFIDKENPTFLDKYFSTKTLKRLKYVTQFCGADYTKLYSPTCLYTRYDHSIVVAHMTWHFTHDKVATIVALLHDVGTPCFAHTIDYVFGDYMKQESSERDILDMIKKDVTLLKYLEEDNVILDSFSDLAKFPILENKSPKLCTDRLDGVLHTCYIWLHTHPLEDIAEVYQDMAVLINENGREEIGFRHKRIATKFCKMVYVYAKELWSNRSKYVSKYVSEIVKLAVEEEKITLDDLYTKKEVEIVSIFKKTFSSWNLFEDATCIMGSEEEPSFFSISFLAKKRNVIPLVQVRKSSMRICDTSIIAKNIYNQLEQYQDYKYGFVESIKEIC